LPGPAPTPCYSRAGGVPVDNRGAIAGLTEPRDQYWLLCLRLTGGYLLDAARQSRV